MWSSLVLCKQEWFVYYAIVHICKERMKLQEDATNVSILLLTHSNTHITTVDVHMYM